MEVKLGFLCYQGGSLRPQGKDHAQGMFMEEEFGCEIVFKPQKNANRDEAVLAICGVQADLRE